MGVTKTRPGSLISSSASRLLRVPNAQVLHPPSIVSRAREYRAARLRTQPRANRPRQSCPIGHAPMSNRAHVARDKPSAIEARSLAWGRARFDRRRTSVKDRWEYSFERRSHAEGRARRSSRRVRRFSHSGGARSSSEGPRSWRDVRRFDGRRTSVNDRQEYSFERRSHTEGRVHGSSRRLKRSSQPGGARSSSEGSRPSRVVHGFDDRRTSSYDGRSTLSNDEVTWDEACIAPPLTWVLDGPASDGDVTSADSRSTGRRSRARRSLFFLKEGQALVLSDR